MSTPADLMSERAPLLHRNPNRRTRSPISPTSPSPASEAGRSSQWNTRFAALSILLCLVLERIAFYGLAGNLVLFLNKDPYKWDSYFAVSASLYFFGVCFIMSLVGGWLADSVFGRFKAIFFSLVIYIAGYILMPFLSSNTHTVPSKHNSTMPSVCKLISNNDTVDNDTNPFDEPCAWQIYITLTIIAIGTGFVKASIAPFGCDQVVREGQQAKLSFFNWFYWSINIGALIGLGLITYIQQQHSFFYGYLTSVSCLGASLLVFILGRFVYTVRSPDGSVLANIFRIIQEACRRKRQRSRAKRVARNNHDRVDEAEPVVDKLTFLDYAKHRHGGIFHDALVEDVKELKKIICVFAVLIPYWLVYFQMQTTFLLQGLHMKMVVPSVHPDNTSCQNSTQKNLTESVLVSEHPQLVAAWFSIFDVMVLIILLPLFDRIIYPRLESRGYQFSISRRMLLGMGFAILAMIVAGIVEMFRLQSYWPDFERPCMPRPIRQYIGNSTYFAADMSILWQIPQYMLIGMSEVFTSVAGLQFAVSVAPKSMKGIIMGLFYLFSGIGSFLGTAIISVLSVTNTWFYSMDYGNINCRGPCDQCTDTTYKFSCHLDYYFYMLAGLELIGAVLFILVARNYNLDQRQRDGTRSPLEDVSGEFLTSTTSQRSGTTLPHSIQRAISSDLPS